MSYHRVVRSHNQVYVSVQPSHAAQICSSKQTYHYRSQQYELEGPSSFARENWISWCCESVCRRRLGQRPCGYRFGIAPRVLNLRISLACCGESLMCGRREEWHSGVREESERRKKKNKLLATQRKREAEVLGTTPRGRVKSQGVIITHIQGRVSLLQITSGPCAAALGSSRRCKRAEAHRERGACLQFSSEGVVRVGGQKVP